MTVFYSEEQIRIVENGIAAIASVLESSDSKSKQSLLLCLDRYLDPYFGDTLPYKGEIFKLLHMLIIRENSLAVKSDSGDLLTMYGTIPLTILENKLDKVETALLDQVGHAIVIS